MAQLETGAADVTDMSDAEDAKASPHINAAAAIM